MRTKAFLLLVAVVSLLAGSCAGDALDEEATVDAVRVTTSLAATTTTAPPTTTTTIDGPPTLEESLGVRSGAGSLVGPGSYRSASSEVPIEYSLGAEASAVIAPVFVAFGPPGFDPFSYPTLTVSTLSGVPTAESINEFNDSPNPPVAPIASGDDLTAFLSDTPGIALLDSGTTDTFAWWDFTTIADGTGFACPWGTACRNVVAAENHGYFVIGEEWTVRLWRFESEPESVYVWLQAPSEAFDDGLEWGTGIVDGMTVG